MDNLSDMKVCLGCRCAVELGLWGGGGHDCHPKALIRVVVEDDSSRRDEGRCV